MDISQVFPIYKIEQDMILSRQGDITAAYAVELPEIFSLNPSGFQAMHAAWNKAIGVLPGQTVLHKQDWFTSKAFQGTYAGKDHSFHSLASERFFEGRPHLEHRCRLFVTKRPKGSKLGNAAVSNLLRKSLIPEEHIAPTIREDFKNVLGQLRQILSDAGIGMRPLTGDEIAGSTLRKGLLEEYLSLDDALVLQDIEFKPEWKIGNKYVQLYTMGDVEDLPSSVSPRVRYEPYGTDQSEFPVGFATPVCGLLPCNHIYNQFIFIEDHQKKLKELESKRLRLESLSSYSRENAIARDATAAFLNEAISSGRKAVKAHFNVMVWTDQKEALGQLRSLTSGALAKMNVVPRQETVSAPQIFWAGLPGNQAAFPVNETFDTFVAQATCFFNTETHYRTSRSPVGIRLGDRITGYPVHVDLSDEPMSRGLITNRNKFVLGPSGSGKSFLTNHLMRSYYEQGTHIVLVDVGHSYRGLCDLVDGY